MRDVYLLLVGGDAVDSIGHFLRPAKKRLQFQQRLLVHLQLPRELLEPRHTIKALVVYLEKFQHQRMINQLGRPHQPTEKSREPPLPAPHGYLSEALLLGLRGQGRHEYVAVVEDEDGAEEVEIRFIPPDNPAHFVRIVGATRTNLKHQTLALEHKVVDLFGHSGLADVAFQVSRKFGTNRSTFTIRKSRHINRNVPVQVRRAPVAARLIQGERQEQCFLLHGIHVT